MLDFVPNHVALDHAWIAEHPEYFVAGTEAELRAEPHNYVRIGNQIFAHGRDPYFPGWRDTLQLNYRHAGLRKAMIEILVGITNLCDGVRCDMAMLLLPNVFKRTWGDRSLPRGAEPVDSPFWPEAIDAARANNDDFLFLSEVYWDLEATLQAQGFDFTYDKSLYDRLCTGDAEAVRDHLLADDEFQSRCSRFLENHDEQRAAAVFEPAMHEAAAVLTYTVPGMRFFHDGQFDGRRKRMNVHLARKAEEFPAPLIRDFYLRLLTCLRRDEFRNGRWRLLSHREAWTGNPTWRSFIAYEWRDDAGQRAWIVVNYGRTQGQCYVDFGDESLRGHSLLLRDQMSRAWYQRDGYELCDRGLFLDLPAWGFHVFDVSVT
ncbi:MAG: alpha-amylase [Pirellulales bacterium]